jgi:hypothetical protein
MSYDFVDLKMSPVWTGGKLTDYETASIDGGKTF